MQQDYPLDRRETDGTGSPTLLQWLLGRPDLPDAERPQPDVPRPARHQWRDVP